MTEKGFSTTPNSIVMPNFDRDSAAGAVLEALGFAIFIRDKAGALRLNGRSPDWLSSIWPGLNAADAPLPIDQASPFLENFLIDAGERWSAGGEKRARSGPWIERTTDGSELTLEATAFTAGGQPILLLERLAEVFEEKRSMLQKARETVIAYQRLDSEMQKKEILLSCISEEMNAALANVITSLRLIELEKNPAHLPPLLNLAARATEEQQTLINKVLNVFATELEGLYGFDASARADAKLNVAVRAAEENVAPRFAERRVRLNVADSVSRESRVAMDAGHLSRVLSSLLENGLQNASALPAKCSSISSRSLIRFSSRYSTTALLCRATFARISFPSPAAGPNRKHRNCRSSSAASRLRIVTGKSVTSRVKKAATVFGSGSRNRFQQNENSGPDRERCADPRSGSQCLPGRIGACSKPKTARRESISC